MRSCAVWTALLCVTARPFPAEAREFPGLSLRGPSGLVLVPTGQIFRSDCYAIGLHRGMLKAAYGLLGLMECGVATPDLYDQPNATAWRAQTTGFLKLGIDALPDRWWAPGLAAGAENSFWNMAVRKADAVTGETAREAETYYCTGSWDWRILTWPVEATVGGGTGRFLGRAFGALDVIPTSIFGSTLKFFAEYAGRAADFGTRFALSRNLRLDFAMEMNVDRRVSGATGGRWSITMDRGIIGASRIGSAGLDRLFHPAAVRR